MDAHTKRRTRLDLESQKGKKNMIARNGKLFWDESGSKTQLRMLGRGEKWDSKKRQNLAVT